MPAGRTPPSVSAHPQAIPDQNLSPLPLLRCYSPLHNLVDQLFDSSEKRLARVPLLLAHFHRTGEAGDGYGQESVRKHEQR